MIDVTDVTSRAEATVTIGVTGAPQLKATYLERHLLPRRIVIKYAYKPNVDADGWTQHTWECVHVTVTGPRILKPAADGSQRLGVEYLRYHPVNRDYPEWLRQLVQELRPSGDIALAGA